MVRNGEAFSWSMVGYHQVLAFKESMSCVKLELFGGWWGYDVWSETRLRDDWPMLGWFNGPKITKKYDWMIKNRCRRLYRSMLMIEWFRLSIFYLPMLCVNQSHIPFGEWFDNKDRWSRMVMRPKKWLEPPQEPRWKLRISFRQAHGNERKKIKVICKIHWKFLWPSFAAGHFQLSNVSKTLTLSHLNHFSITLWHVETRCAFPQLFQRHRPREPTRSFSPGSSSLVSPENIESHVVFVLPCARWWVAATGVTAGWSGGRSSKWFCSGLVDHLFQLGFGTCQLS